MNASGAQLVGFMVNSARSRLTTTERRSSGIPSRIEGSGSETARTWALTGVDVERMRITTLPRSNGPATAGVIAARLSGAPL